MSKRAVRRGASSRAFTSALALLVIGWSQTAAAVSVPVLYGSVDGAPEVSFENDQVCDGTKAVICLGTGAVGDLLISSFELRLRCKIFGQRLMPGPFNLARQEYFRCHLGHLAVKEA